MPEEALIEFERDAIFFVQRKFSLWAGSVGLYLLLSVISTSSLFSNGRGKVKNSETGNTTCHSRLLFVSVLFLYISC